MTQDQERPRPWSVVRRSNDLGVSEVSASLKGQSVALVVGGGIAAIESPRIARSLRRLGADVQAFATDQALQFVGAKSLEWATANPVVTSPSGLSEHVSTHDVVLVACATADLIAKAAHGICSDGPSTLIQSALGARIPVVIAPTMHESLANAPAVQRNLESLGATARVAILQPRSEEGKHKSREPAEVADEVSHAFHKLNWRQHGQPEAHARQVVVTFGGTRVPIDSVRAVTNRSTGALGAAFVAELYRWGYEITALQGDTSVAVPRIDGVRYLDCQTYQAMHDEFLSLHPKDYRAVFMLAAISDYCTEPGSSIIKKISSDLGELTVALRPATKLVSTDVFAQFPFRFACKLTQDTSDESKAALRRLADVSSSHCIYWNTVEEAFGGKLHSGRLWKASEPLQDSLLCTSKHAVARLAVELFRAADGRDSSPRELNLT